jgi:HrpA-like RNA helicase
MSSSSETDEKKLKEEYENPDTMQHVGILDPDGKFSNPLNDRPYSDYYRELAKVWTKFPAYENARSTIDAIKANQVILVVSSTGSGKTVLVPKFALHALGYQTSRIAVTLPKQIIAQSAAEFAAKTLDVELGEEVGYQFKGSDRGTRGPNTRLLYATDGTIVARLLNDHELKDFDAVIIDEAHERKVQIDFLLFLLKGTLKARPEFKLIIMSATVNEEIFESYFTEFRYVSLKIGGRTNYPIESLFLDKPITEKDYIEKGYQILKDIVTNDDPTMPGDHDILFFVTSVNEALDVCERIAKDSLNVYCIEVFAGMDSGKQELAQDKDKYKKESSKGRKVVIATNVAESSLTIDGIKYVIDSGYELSGHYDADKRAKVLEKRLISRAQATQRKGRSGRTGPGICYHLYTEDAFENTMMKYPEPTIRTSNIYGECLRLLVNPQVRTLENLMKIFSEFIEPPREKYIKNAFSQLKQLGLVEDNQLSELGLIISELQADPMAALAIYKSKELKCLNEVTAILSCIDASKGNLGNIFLLPADIVDAGPENKGRLQHLTHKFKTALKKIRHKDGDHLTIYKIFKKFKEYHDKNDEKKIGDFCYEHFIKKGTLFKAVKFYQKLKNNSKRILYKSNRGEREEVNIEDDIVSSESDSDGDSELSRTTGGEESLENRIMASLAYGFKINRATLSSNKETYDTSYAKNVKISRDSVISLEDKKPKEVMYFELFSSGIRSDLNIVSKLSPKVLEMLNK